MERLWERLRGDPFPLVFGVCALATVALLWSVAVLPMADAPQHEAQVAIWKRLGSGGFEDELYRLDLLSPYVLGDVMAYVLSAIMPVDSAMRVVVTISSVGLPASMWAMLRQGEGDRWWALAGFPFAFGVGFYWGFLPYLLALPLGALVLVASSALSRAPSLRRGAVVFALTTLMLSAHGLTWGLFGLAAVWVVISQPEVPWRQKLLNLLPLALTVPLAVASTGEIVAATHGAGTEWDLRPGRIALLYMSLLGQGNLALLAFGVITLGVAGSAHGVSRSWTARGLAVFGLCVFVFSPLTFLGDAILYPRFGVFAAMLILPAFVAADPSRRRSMGRGALAAVALGWIAVLGVRFADFDREVDRWRDVTASVPGNSVVLSLVADSAFDPLYGRPLSHVPALLARDKPILVEPSFAHYGGMPINFRPGARRAVRDVFHPEQAIAELSSGDYDYVVVRRVGDPLADYPPLVAWTEIARSGAWFLYRKR